MPISALAFTGSGSGTVGSPYMVTTCTQLAEMENARSSYYTLANNIDCSGYGAWTPIGQGGSFSGTLDGAGYTISNLTITRTATYTGLFKITIGATIKNVKISNAAISSTQYFVGGITGFDNGSTFSKVGVSSSTISSSYSGGVFMGGIIGAWWGSGSTTTISDSYVASTTISNASGSRVGGLIGDIDASGVMTTIINRSYFQGTITGSGNVGGLVGFYYNGGSLEQLYINDSFATATTTPSGASAGGIVGYLYNANYFTFTNTYYDAKGNTSLKCGYSGYTITGCTAVNTDNSAPNYFKNSSSVAPMSAWDFTSVWATTANYPVLIGDGVSAPVADSATGYYDAWRMKKVAALKVKLSLLAHPGVIAPADQTVLTVTAAVSGRQLDWRELTARLEYGRCDAGEYRKITKSAGDIRFGVGVENSLFFSNGVSSVAEGERIAWVFPLVINDTAYGKYCIRAESDNGPSVDVSEAAQLTVATPVIAEIVESELSKAEEPAKEPEACSPEYAVAIKPGKRFDRELVPGARGSDVAALQKFLNDNGFFVARFGIGAHGEETGYFGEKTEAALVVFQGANGLLAEAGSMGRKTMRAINALAEDSSVMRCGALVGASKQLRVNMRMGDSGRDIMVLQKFLNKNGFGVGAGADGETGYFGPATRAAVERLQKAFGIKGGLGDVGPITRSFINNL